MTLHPGSVAFSRPESFCGQAWRNHRVVITSLLRWPSGKHGRKLYLQRRASTCHVAVIATEAQYRSPVPAGCRRTGLRRLCQCSGKQAFQHGCFLRGCRASACAGTAGSRHSTSFRGRLIPPKGRWRLQRLVPSARSPHAPAEPCLASASQLSGHQYRHGSHTLMRVSGGTLSRCRRKVLFGWPAMSRSRIIRVLAFGPLTARVSSATANFDGSSPSCRTVFLHWRR